MLEIRQIRAQDLAVLQAWYDDPEIARRMSYPSDEWFRYVMETDGVKCWAFTQDSELVAQIQVDREDKIGFIDIAVRPALRGRQIGTQALTLFLENEGRKYSMIEASVEPDNIASLRCFTKCGFTFSKDVDDEGFVHGRFRVREPAPVR